MVNEPITTPVTAIETPVISQPVQTVVEPVVAPVVTSEPVSAPVEAAAPAVEATKVETVLGEALKPVEPIAPVTPKLEGGQSEEPAPPPSQETVNPVYDAFTLPEDVKLDAERVTKFTELLADLEIKGKTDHALMQEFGQKAVDFHLNEVKKSMEDLNKFYQTTWERQKLDWKDQFLKDPEIGGNKFQTTVDSALTFLRTHGGTAEQQSEFRAIMESSGLGNHPVMIRLLANAGRAMSEGTPLAAQRPVQPPKSKTQTMYGKNS